MAFFLSPLWSIILLGHSRCEEFGVLDNTSLYRWACSIASIKLTGSFPGFDKMGDVPECICLLRNLFSDLFGRYLGVQVLRYCTVNHLKKLPNFCLKKKKKQDHFIPQTHISISSPVCFLCYLLQSCKSKWMAYSCLKWCTGDRGIWGVRVLKRLQHPLFSLVCNFCRKIVEISFIYKILKELIWYFAAAMIKGFDGAPLPHSRNQLEEKERRGFVVIL